MKKLIVLLVVIGLGCWGAWAKIDKRHSKQFMEENVVLKEKLSGLYDLHQDRIGTFKSKLNWYEERYGPINEPESETVETETDSEETEEVEESEDAGN